LWPSACCQEPARDDEAKIETLENSFIAAFNAKDVDAIMKCYVPGASLVVFDLTPPRQYLGADGLPQGLAGISETPTPFRIS